MSIRNDCEGTIAIGSGRSIEGAKRPRSFGPDEPSLEAVIGTPLDGEHIGGEMFDGNSEAAIYPGELPRDPEAVFRDELRAAKPNEIDYRFVRFRPPVPVRAEDDSLLPPPHIRLDRALQFLLADRLG